MSYISLLKLGIHDCIQTTDQAGREGWCRVVQQRHMRNTKQYVHSMTKSPVIDSVLQCAPLAVYTKLQKLYKVVETENRLLHIVNI